MTPLNKFKKVLFVTKNLYLYVFFSCQIESYYFLLYNLKILIFFSFSVISVKNNRFFSDFCLKNQFLFMF